ncbi:GPI ethanolamine phosphate transferase 1 [Anopheles nili]|uniref:GPI ethanolamine phosphate transferase 1 n=1 Tax=Anopheles nili TaxID=185578 RepID=UPI00237BBC64|nr:GPI ethanolamine phosphate transferase 1 [Anopheles nili]
MRLLIVAVVIHVLFLLSIFYIHFQSPILKDLPVGGEHDQPPADRLVLFIGDGLRAESFLKYDLNRTSFLRNILLTEGVFGISSTRVPTESRPGHAALLGGVYEDPSAVFRGWKENPVEFDSVLNRSSTSYSWGSPDIVNMFSRGATQGRVHVAAYDSNDESFAQSANTSLLDIWVFDRVRQFLSKEDTIRDVFSRKKVILFLHLLGLDTAGHVHKPHSTLFTENLIIVDEGIKSIVQLVEQVSQNDRRTAFIFTSDHGMTDQGSHGSGHPLETETPFLAWGAGFNHAANGFPVVEDVLALGDKKIPIHYLNQADVAPLISAVLGISVPKNNLGKLPRSLLSVSEEYAAWAMKNNADQLLAQYNRWQRESEGKMLQWLTSTKQTSFKILIEALQSEISSATLRKQYSDVQTLCKMLMDTTLSAIEYFQSYYKPHLFVALTLTMLGWLLLLAKETFSVNAGTHLSAYHLRNSRSVATIAMLIAVLVVAFNIVQNTPVIVVLYFVIPIALWGFIGTRWRKYVLLVRGKSGMYFAGFVVAVEFLVLAFMDRRLLALLLWIHCFLVVKPLFNNKNKLMILRWIICNGLLSGFFLIPTIGRDNSSFLLLSFSVIVWTVINITSIYKTKHGFVFKSTMLLIHLLQPINLLVLINFIEGSKHIPMICRSLCWMFSAFGLLLPFFTSTCIQDRVWALFNGLSAPYMMLSLSYEPLFLLCFCYTLYVWLQLENIASNKTIKLNAFYFSTSLHTEGTIGFDNTRRTFGFMLFLLTSFFGTGNLATVSSFDPNWVRCFVATFSPFTMMALILLKLLIPVILLVCVLRAMVIVCSVHKTKLFNLTLIVCDWMCLNYFFLVRNQGSWMDIGSSISHFVILECTTILVIMFYELARIVTEVSLTTRSSRSEEHSASSQRLPFVTVSNKERIE